MKRKRLIRWIAAVLAALAILGTAEGIRSNTALTVRSYTVESERAAGTFRIVFLSDLHGKEFGEDNRRLLDAMSAQAPDLIALVGDFFNSDADVQEIEAMCSFIRSAASIAPVYFGMGNHEAAYIRNHQIDLATRITEAGATVLDNQYIDLEIRGTPVRIGGYMGYYRQPGMTTSDPEQMQFERDFAQAFEDTDRFKLLLNHIPTAWLDWRYIDQYPVDLVLSGHYHGGVVRIPVLERGVYAPYVGWFPPYTRGMYRGETAVCVLTTGLAGSFGIPRFFNLPEICVVDVVPVEAK